jgi:5-methylcytosine-specific restriction protein A
MPQLAKRFCLRPGCPSLVPSGYCDKHKPVVDQTEKNQIYDWKWRCFRKAFLADNPLCADCLADGRVTAATELHHRIKARLRPDLRLDPNNILQLCDTHHNIRTARGE